MAGKRIMPVVNHRDQAGFTYQLRVKVVVGLPGNQPDASPNIK
jgi:hypothetical protein